MKATKSNLNQPPKESNLINCIRLYFQVDKSITNRGKLIKYYINEIIQKRTFENRYKGKDFNLFIEYYKTECLVLSINQKNIFEKYEVNQRTGKSILNKYLNLLITECLQDLENGFLKIQEFRPVPKTQTQNLKQYNNLTKEIGVKSKIPLRKKSNKELLKDFQKKCSEIIETSNKPL